MRYILIIFISIAIFACGSKDSLDNFTNPKPNVLFITIDDLRPQLGCYGDTVIQAPNIDRLASRGLVFQKAYCQYALCGPSRSSFLTGLRPETTKVYDLHRTLRDYDPALVTLPQLFKNNGYQTHGLFKVFHVVGFDPALFGNKDDAESWSDGAQWIPSRSAWGPQGDSIYQSSKRACLAKGEIGYGNIPRSYALEAPEIPDSLLSDGEMALEAIRRLRSYGNQPFFLATGFYHPHLPFVAPKKYWDLYDSTDIVLPQNQYLPKDAPPYVALNTNELRSYPDIPDQGEFSDSLKRKLLHGYMASISYVDVQVGLILDELERLGLHQNTIVVLLGDHGYQIGEHNHWCKKHCNFEMATRVPLIIAYPGQKSGGQATESLVELLDLYPTLAELAGLQPPDYLEGQSLVPILEDPNSEIHQAAVSSYRMGGRHGTSFRTQDIRFTSWEKQGEETNYELYDHQIDPDENVNRAGWLEYQDMRRALETYSP